MLKMVIIQIRIDRRAPMMRPVSGRSQQYEIVVHPYTLGLSGAGAVRITVLRATQIVPCRRLESGVSILDDVRLESNIIHYGDVSTLAGSHCKKNRGPVLAAQPGVFQNIARYYNSLSCLELNVVLRVPLVRCSRA